MKKPTFFAIGAAKCGTTLMARWLAEHPNIYMSPVKEPNFFNADDRWTVTRTLRQYEALFRDAGPEHIAVGEASVQYLFTREAEKYYSVLSKKKREYAEKHLIEILRSPKEDDAI